MSSRHIHYEPTYKWLGDKNQAKAPSGSKSKVTAVNPGSKMSPLLDAMYSTGTA